MLTLYPGKTKGNVTGRTLAVGVGLPIPPLISLQLEKVLDLADNGQVLLVFCRALDHVS